MLNTLRHNVHSRVGVHPFVDGHDQCNLSQQPSVWDHQPSQPKHSLDTKKRKESTYEQYYRLSDKLYQKALTMDSSSSDKYWVAVAGGPGSGE
mgnify:CR=1 FL=1